VKVTVTDPEGKVHEILVAEFVGEYFNGREGKTYLCVVTHSRTVYFDRRSRVSTEPGLDAYFYDELGRRIESRWVGFVEKDGEIVRAAESMAVSKPVLPSRPSTQRRSSGPVCPGCGGPTEYAGEPCKKCSRRF
jgi:hypothetical protein